MKLKSLIVCTALTITPFSLTNRAEFPFIADRERGAAGKAAVGIELRSDVVLATVAP
jgi:hypothetical protein